MDQAEAVGERERDDAGLDRVLTIPNVLTLVRLLCIPLFLWVLFGLDRPGPAAVVLAVVSSTDWVDGYVARHFDQVSNLGKAIDPTVDRALIVFGFGGILLYGAVPAWAGIAVIAREVGMSIYVISLLALGATRMDVTWFGKAQTMLLMISFPSFLASTDTAWSDGVTAFFRGLAWLTLIPGLLFSAIAVAQYLPRGMQSLREGRAGRADVHAGT